MDNARRSAYVRMRELASRNVLATVVVALLIGLGVGSSGSSASEAGAYRDRLADARDDIAAMREAAEEDASSLADVEAERDELASENGQLASENDELSTQLASLEEKLARMNARRRLPSLSGRNAGYADDLADRYGWKLSVDARYSTERPGTIIAQSPAAGTMMRYGAPFNVVIAKSIPRVPNVIGTSKGAAAKEIRLAGWTVTFVEQVSDAKPGTIVSMSPAGGARVMPGQTVTLVVAKKAPPPPPPAPAPDPAPADTSGGSSSDGSAPSGDGCTPGYSPCLPPAPDYDCAGGTGDGPKYTGYVRVTGSDPYDLDADNDGVGCES